MQSLKMRNGKTFGQKLMPQDNEFMHLIVIFINWARLGASPVWFVNVQARDKYSKYGNTVQSILSTYHYFKALGARELATWYSIWLVHYALMNFIRRSGMDAQAYKAFVNVS